MKRSEQPIYVYADWQELQKPELVGTLTATPARSKLIFSFEYEKTWLKSNSAFTLDPSLQLFHGRQYSTNDQDNFGIFLDSSPDRWGRLLMKRREAQLARKQNRKTYPLLESDYLLGVYDQHRIGALRFKTDLQGDFLDNDKTLASPPWASVRELEQASLLIEKPRAEKDPDYSKWLAMLIAPGGSLGGARPKASIIDDKNNLWIAKFPSNHDEYDIGAWEKLTSTLAEKAGISTSQSILKKLNSRQDRKSVV